MRTTLGFWICLQLLTPTSVSGQTGSVMGRVTDPGGRPLDAVQVSLEDVGALTFTNSRGEFLLVGVSVGERTIYVERIGYRAASQIVNVTAATTARVDFVLSERAIALDEIVVTGTAVASERRAVANTIATIDATAVADAPVTSFSNLLQGRAEGVVVLPSSGMTGESSKIRIRGSGSISLNKEPIIYLDGVRIDATASLPFTQIGTPSRLDDIPPDAIERIEILKGAAASTLYGSEASNGVIQIFTKRGSVSSTQWSFDASEGFIRMPTGRMTPAADFPANLCFFNPACIEANTQRIQSFWGESLQPYEVFERDILPQFFETGRFRTLSGAVTGGVDNFTYRLGLRYGDEDGPFGLEELGPARDANRRVQGTATASIFPSDNLQIDLTLLAVDADHTTVLSGNDLLGTFTGGFGSQLRLANENNLFGQTLFATTRETMHVEVEQASENFTGIVGLRADLHPLLDLDATLGVNVVNELSSTTRPFGWKVDGFSRFPDARGIEDRNFREVTGDAKANLRVALGSSVSTVTTVGGQGYTRTTRLTGGGGAIFPGPGLRVVSATASQVVAESLVEVGGIGAYGQSQIGYRDAVFFTAGARFDASSTFGSNFDAAVYPKAGLSVLPLEFLGGGGPLTTLRVRAAWGQSGLQPASYTSFTTLAPVQAESGAGFVQANLGNPDLEPEVSTEWELGAEAGLFDDRVGIDVTYWNRVVDNALMPGQFPVSGGFSNPQLTNIGRLEGRGVDLSVDAVVLDRSDVSLSVFANGAFLREEVVDLGGSPEVTVGGSYTRYRSSIREGFAPGAFFGARLADVAIPLDLTRSCSEPTREEALAFFSVPRFPLSFEVLPVDCGGDVLGQYLGKPVPDWQGSFGGTLSLFGQVEVAALFEYKARNFHAQDLSGAFRRSAVPLGLNTPTAARVHAALMDPSSSADERLEAALIWARELRSLFPMAGLNQIYPADFVRWRELSVTYRIPPDVLDRVGLASASVSLGGQNLALWGASQYPGLDPESNVFSRCSGDGLACGFNLATEMWGLPLPQRFTINLRLGF